MADYGRKYPLIFEKGIDTKGKSVGYLDHFQMQLYTERFTDFQDVAKRRFAVLAASGKAIPWENMFQYLGARIAKKPANRPQAKGLSGAEGH